MPEANFNLLLACASSFSVGLMIVLNWYAPNKKDDCNLKDCQKFVQQYNSLVQSLRTEIDNSFVELQQQRKVLAHTSSFFLQQDVDVELRELKEIYSQIVLLCKNPPFMNSKQEPSSFLNALSKHQSEIEAAAESFFRKRESMRSGSNNSLLVTRSMPI